MSSALAAGDSLEHTPHRGPPPPANRRRGRVLHRARPRQGDPVNRHALLGLGLIAMLGAATLTAGCGDSNTNSGTGGDQAAAPLIGVDYPRSDTDFWNSYIKYVPQFSKELGVQLKTTNSQNDIAT